MAFYIYDLIFLLIFCIAIAIFLYAKRKNLKRDMKIAFLYRSQWGVKLIKYIGKKYTKTLNFLKYVIIAMSYFLMAGILYLIFRSVYIYARYPTTVTKLVKAPPIAPVIPYFPTLFGMNDFFPPFPFVSFLVALAITAIVHEFSHGIFMAHNKVRIKSTGILFLGPLLGAFVEQDEKDMEKIKKTDQMAILGAGVFANIITGLVFYLVWAGLFFITFTPSGAVFDTYATSIVDINNIESIGGIPINANNTQEIINIINNSELPVELVSYTNAELADFIKVVTKKRDFLITKELLIKQLELNQGIVGLYEDLPAIREGLIGTIIEIDGEEIKTHEDLTEILDNKKPGEEISIKTRFKDEIQEYEFELSQHPENSSKPMIGIANSRVKKNMAESFSRLFKDLFTEYQFKSEFLVFLYYMVFWIFLINILVGFFNMLPLAILDGGRFFYLTVWGITGSEKIGRRAFKWVGLIILAGFILMMMSWLFGIVS
ncbi:hypothetical protein GF386_06335 [Candidatus Pacearchaeota archaeon]|nr:hypothetical protein [Candidatus Pacearchaeota archaeon]MBD3283707.1 hypothetical protein [Candidatus Pacearchaeota archaeon]